MGLLGKKYLKIGNAILGPVLFVWLSFAIYRQIEMQPDLKQSWQSIKSNLQGDNLWLFFLLLMGMCVNVFLDAARWRFLVKKMEIINWPNAFKAVLTGHAVGISTINHLGDPLAKAAYLEDGNRIRGALMGFLGFFSHLMVVSLLGILSLLYMRFFLHTNMPVINEIPHFVVDSIIYALTAGWMLFALFYFRVSGVVRWLEQIKWVRPYQYFLEKMESYTMLELNQLLYYSFARFGVMGLQFILAFYLFDVFIQPWYVFVLLAAMMFSLTLVPSMALADIGIRGKVSLYLFGLYSANSLGILSAVGIMWLVNVILPAVLGTILILSIKITRQKIAT
jgi:hypothetical protein